MRSGRGAAGQSLGTRRLGVLWPWGPTKWPGLTRLTEPLVRSIGIQIWLTNHHARLRNAGGRVDRKTKTLGVSSCACFDDGVRRNPLTVSTTRPLLPSSEYLPRHTAPATPRTAPPALVYSLVNARGAMSGRRLAR